MKYIIIIGIIIGIAWFFKPKPVVQEVEQPQIQLGGRTSELPSGGEELMVN